MELDTQKIDIEEILLDKVIGSLPDPLMRKVNDCLKAALGLP